MNLDFLQKGFATFWNDTAVPNNLIAYNSITLPSPSRGVLVVGARTIEKQETVCLREYVEVECKLRKRNYVAELMLLFTVEDGAETVSFY